MWARITQTLRKLRPWSNAASSGALSTGKGPHCASIPTPQPTPTAGAAVSGSQLLLEHHVQPVSPVDARLLGELRSYYALQSQSLVYTRWVCKKYWLSFTATAKQKRCSTWIMKFCPLILIPLGPRSSSVTRNRLAEYSCCILTGPQSPTLWLTDSSHTFSSPIARSTFGICHYSYNIRRVLIPILSPWAANSVFCWTGLQTPLCEVSRRQKVVLPTSQDLVRVNILIRAMSKRHSGIVSAHVKVT